MPKLRLIRDSHDSPSEWFESFGEALPPMHEIVVDDPALVAMAAINRAGVALVRETLLAYALDNGTVAPLFGKALPTRYGYYFVCPLSRSFEPKIATVRSWPIWLIARHSPVNHAFPRRMCSRESDRARRRCRVARTRDAVRARRCRAGGRVARDRNHQGRNRSHACNAWVPPHKLCFIGAHVCFRRPRRDGIRCPKRDAGVKPPLIQERSSRPAPEGA
jgi:hypothetical protein